MGIIPYFSLRVSASLIDFRLLSLIIMKISRSLRLPFEFPLLWAIASMIWIQAAPLARAQDREPDPVVVYDSSLVQIQGQLPLTTSYEIAIQSPSNLPSASTPITFDVSATNKPDGVSAATAVSYISFSPATLTYTGPSQSQVVRITMSVPADAIAGSYNYKILAVGWPVDPEVGLINLGTFINSTLTAAAQPKTPPTITISTPLNGSTIKVPAGGLPASVPLFFTAAVPGSNPTPIDSVTVELDNNPVTLSTLDGLQTMNVVGSATLVVPAEGQHTITARAHNAAGTAITTNTFTITVLSASAAPPEVVIGTPSDGQVITVPYSSLDAQGRASVPLTFTSTAPAQYPVTQVDADVDDVVVLQQTGLNSTSLTSQATLLVGIGQHTVTAQARNAIDVAQDVNDFEVRVTGAPPPVITISNPLPGSTKTFLIGSAPFIVPFSFTAKSVAAGGLIRSVSATMDGATTPLNLTTSALDAKTVTASIDLSFLAAGAHTLSVVAVDDYGNATAASNFTIVVLVPAPTINITAPSDNAVITLPSGATTGNVPFSFTTTSNNGGVVETVSATLDGNPVPAGSISTPKLGTPSAVSTGQLLNVGVGTHTLVTTGVSSGIVVTDTVQFTVKRTSASVPVLPSVAISTPPVGSSYTRVSDGPALSIPLTFTGTSNTSGGVITKLTASLDGTPLTVKSTTLGQKVASGSATLSVTSAGTHTISVSAVDAYGTASATRTFTVCVVSPKKISGLIFFDVNYNGLFDGDDNDSRGNYCRNRPDWDDCRGSRYDQRYDRGRCYDYGDRSSSRDNDDDRYAEDFGLGGVTVKLLNSSRQVLATTTTAADGSYSFSIGPGSYIVSAVAPAGYDGTTQTERSVTVSSKNVSVRDIGFGLDHGDIRSFCASGKDYSFWKTQIDKAINGDKKNVQISATTCNSHTTKIRSLSLSIFDDLSLKKASSALGTKSSSSRDKLTRELCAAEYNYTNGAYINGDKTLTYCFIQWAERVLNTPSKYSDSYRTWTANWLQAYNCSGGGKVAGPK